MPLKPQDFEHVNYVWDDAGAWNGCSQRVLHPDGADQNSTPGCARMPWSLNGCLTGVMSVTRSA
jgi:hypothetical protein